MSTLATTGAASALGMIMTAAMPSAAKVAAPSSTVTTTAGTASARRCTSKPTRPMTSMTTVMTTETRAVEPRRPATYAQPGSGVPRMRLSSPLSRWIAMPPAMFTNWVMMIP